MSQEEIETNDEFLSNVLSDSQEYPPINDEISPPSSISSSPLFKYRTNTLWRLLSGVAINLLLPFINGLMLGFGELFAHETAFRLGWGGTKVFPMRRRYSIRPDTNVRERPTDRKRQELNDLTSLE